MKTSKIFKLVLVLFLIITLPGVIAARGLIGVSSSLGAEKAVYTQISRPEIPIASVKLSSQIDPVVSPAAAASLKASGNIVTADNCSQSAVADAIVKANDGDTVFVPSGDCSSSNQWSGYLTVEKQITIQGAGIGKTIIGISTHSSGFYVKRTDNVRITGFTFDGRHNNSSASGLILVGDDDTNPTGITRDFRIDHNRFINCNDPTWPSLGNTGWAAITVRGYTYGVIDHNVFEDANGEVIDICADGVMGGLDRSVEYGQYTNGTVYIEDNTWNYIHESENAVDGNSASRYVFRYNTINMTAGSRMMAPVSNHETCATCSCDSGTTGDAGSVVMEVYGNKLYNNNTGNYGAGTLVIQRGGRALIYNNTVYNVDTYNSHIVRLSNVRSYHRPDCGAVHQRGYSYFCHERDGTYLTEGTTFDKTTLDGALGNDNGCPTLAGVADFPTYGGSIIVDDEQIDYTGISGRTLTPCVRGANGTTRAAHTNGSGVDLLIFGKCLEQINNTYVWGNKTVGDMDKNGVLVLDGDTPDYSAYDIQSYTDRPNNWQYRNDGTIYSYTPYPYPHPLTRELLLSETSADRAIHLEWDVYNATLLPTTTWKIDYYTTTTTAPFTVTGLISTTRSFTLTEHVQNYQWYTVTLYAMLDETPWLSDTVRVMPTDRFVYLPLVLK